MNDVLLDPIRHNNWATKELVAFCRERSLTEQQLTTSGVGTYGSILATLNHLITSDAHYLGAVLGNAPAWAQSDEDAGLDVLASWVEEMATRWEQLLSGPIDVDRTIVVDDGENEVRAGIFIAQALNHGNLHREQVCVRISALDIEPPDLQAWEYAWATGRIWKRAS